MAAIDIHDDRTGESARRTLNLSEVKANGRPRLLALASAGCAGVPFPFPPQQLDQAATAVAQTLAAIPAPTEPATRECPFCLSLIPIKARRCAHCTSELKVA